jgi:hypothetical protein
MRLFLNFHDHDLEEFLERLGGGEEGTEEDIGAEGPCEEDGLGEGDDDSIRDEEEGIREEVDGLGGICCALAMIKL